MEGHCVPFHGTLRFAAIYFGSSVGPEAAKYSILSTPSAHPVAAGAMPQRLCCTCSNCCTGHTDRQSPPAALATQISMPQVLHWGHSSAFPKCCTGHADEHAPSTALATKIGMLQLLHWPHNSACPKCCTGHTDQPTPNAALATQIGMLEVMHRQHRSACPK